MVSIKLLICFVQLSSFTLAVTDIYNKKGALQECWCVCANTQTAYTVNNHKACTGDNATFHKELWDEKVLKLPGVKALNKKWFYGKVDCAKKDDKGVYGDMFDRITRSSV